MNQSPLTPDNQDTNIEQSWLERVSALSLANVDSGKGGPFAAIVIQHGKIIAEATNTVLETKDPTAHAEVNAIRVACQYLNSFQLENCILISSCEPCPMCLGAIYWARPKAVYFMNSREDAAGIGFDDQFIYSEISMDPAKRKIPFIFIDYPEAKQAFRQWKTKTDKTTY